MCHRSWEAIEWYLNRTSNNPDHEPEACRQRGDGQGGSFWLPIGGQTWTTGELFGAGTATQQDLGCEELITILEVWSDQWFWWLNLIEHPTSIWHWQQQVCFSLIAVRCQTWRCDMNWEFTYVHPLHINLTLTVDLWTRYDRAEGYVQSQPRHQTFEVGGRVRHTLLILKVYVPRVHTVVVSDEDSPHTSQSTMTRLRWRQQAIWTRKTFWQTCTAQSKLAR